MNLHDRIITLETKFNERWDAHDKLQIEAFKNLQQTLDSMNESLKGHQDKMQKVDCLSTKVNMLSRNVAFIWSGFLSVLVLGVVLGLWIKFLN